MKAASVGGKAGRLRLGLGKKTMNSCLFYFLIYFGLEFWKEGGS